MNKMNEGQEKNKFIENELFTSCKSAAFGRVLRFNKEAMDYIRTKEYFDKDLKGVFRVFIETDSQDDQFKKIATLQKSFDDTAEKYKQIFKSEKPPFVTVGMTQKFLNLYLKYRWCLGDYPKPLHCPIDSQVLKLKKIAWEGPPWSKFSLEDYRNAIDKLKKQLEINDLALWELDFFNSNNPYYR